MLLLDDQAISGLAALHPSVADALANRVAAAAPEGGRRLTRLTMAPGANIGPSLIPARPAPLPVPTADEIKRATGSFGTVS
jgi:hypothetical protein